MDSQFVPLFSFHYETTTKARLIFYAKEDASFGCIPLSQSKSGFCDRKFDFLFH